MVLRFIFSLLLFIITTIFTQFYHTSANNALHTPMVTSVCNFINSFNATQQLGFSKCHGSRALRFWISMRVKRIAWGVRVVTSDQRKVLWRRKLQRQQGGWLNLWASGLLCDPLSSTLSKPVRHVQSCPSTARNSLQNWEWTFERIFLKHDLSISLVKVSSRWLFFRDKLFFSSRLFIFLLHFAFLESGNGYFSKTLRALLLKRIS